MKFNLSYLLAALFFFAASCKKESNSKNSEAYIASPQKLVDLTGSDWASNKSQFSNKKDYWYSGFTQNQSSSVEAAVSLKALEETYPDIFYYMLMNVRRGTGKISVVSVGTIDSVKTLTRQDAYNLMKFYYNEVLRPATDTNFTMGNYSTPDGTQIQTTVIDILEKLNNGYDAPWLSISYNTNHGAFGLLVNKEYNNPDNYQFSFNGHYN